MINNVPVCVTTPYRLAAIRSIPLMNKFGYPKFYGLLCMDQTIRFDPKYRDQWGLALGYSGNINAIESLIEEMDDSLFDKIVLGALASRQKDVLRWAGERDSEYVAWHIDTVPFTWQERKHYLTLSNCPPDDHILQAIILGDPISIPEYIDGIERYFTVMVTYRRWDLILSNRKGFELHSDEYASEACGHYESLSSIPILPTIIDGHIMLSAIVFGNISMIKELIRKYPFDREWLLSTACAVSSENRLAIIELFMPNE